MLTGVKRWTVKTRAEKANNLKTVVNKFHNTNWTTLGVVWINPTNQEWSINARSSDAQKRSNPITISHLHFSLKTFIHFCVRFPLGRAGVAFFITQDSSPQVRIGTKTDLKFNSFAVFQRSRKTAFALLVRLSIYLSSLPSFVNTTTGHLNFSTCCSVLLLAFGMHWIGFLDRHNTVKPLYSCTEVCVRIGGVRS